MATVGPVCWLFLGTWASSMIGWEALSARLMGSLLAGLPEELGHLPHVMAGFLPVPPAPLLLSSPHFGYEREKGDGITCLTPAASSVYTPPPQT